MLLRDSPQEALRSCPREVEGAAGPAGLELAGFPPV